LAVFRLALCQRGHAHVVLLSGMKALDEGSAEMLDLIKLLT
jgi:hypothetical protein